MTKLIFFESAVDVRTELNLLTAGIKQFFPEEELKHVRDLQKFVLKKEDGWVLDKHLHALVSEILSEPRSDFTGLKVSVLRLFSVCALRENFIHFLNLDRQDRTLMNYAALDFKSLSLNEQKGLILLFCNMFATESRRWLMYFSEWETDAGDVTSNAKITTTLACKAMDSLNPQIQLYASGLVYNMSAADYGISQSLDVLIEPLCPEDQPMGSVNVGNDDGMCHLKAHNMVFLEICLATFDTVKRKTKTLQEDILWNYLQTLEKILSLPNIRADFVVIKPEFGQDVESLAQVNSLSQRNRSKLDSLRAQTKLR